MKTIFVLFDSLNRRALSSYGGSMPTPNFDRLADRGVAFENHYMGSSPCMPARRDFLTGRYNFFHSSWGPMEPYDNSLPEILRQELGTYTHLITDHFHYFESGGSGYHTRYDSYEFMRGQEYDAWQAEVNPDIEAFGRIYDPKHFDFKGGARSHHRIQYAVNSKYGVTGEKRYPLVKCFDSALDFLQRNGNEDNWFLQLECFDPHEPFDVPERYLDKLQVQEEMVLSWPHYERVSETPEEVERIRKRYAALVAMCDDQLGRVLDYMDQKQMWDDTAVILTTDHGYLLSEHDWWAKVIMPNYQEISHLPLIMYHPAIGESRGTSRSYVTSSIDVMPTILEFFGVPAQGEVRGESLYSILKDDSDTPRTVVGGVFGGSCMITNGEYVYHLFPDPIDSTNLYEYRVHPSHMRGDFTIEELSDMVLHPGFDFTKGIGVLRIKARDDSKRVPNHDAQGFQDRGSRLFHLPTDPGEETSLDVPEIVDGLKADLWRIMQRHDAPPELFLRYDLESSSPQHQLMQDSTVDEEKTNARSGR